MKNRPMSTGTKPSQADGCTLQQNNANIKQSPRKIPAGWAAMLFFGLMLIAGTSGCSGDAPNSGSDGNAEEVAAEAVYTCSMHPEVRSDEPGTCPICNMYLIPMEEMESDDGEGGVDAGAGGDEGMGAGMDAGAGGDEGMGADHDHEGHAHDEADGTVMYTCSMHPEVRSEKPVTCPICNMYLIPVEEAETDEGVDDGEDKSSASMHGSSHSAPAAGDERAGTREGVAGSDGATAGARGGPVERVSKTMSRDAVSLAQVQTVAVSKQTARHTLTVQGRMELDPDHQTTLASYVDGRLTDVFFRDAGQIIQKGDPLFTIYSPLLISAQKELIEAVATEGAVAIEGAVATEGTVATEGAPSSASSNRRLRVNSAKTRLIRLGLTEDQTEAIARMSEPQEEVTIMAAAAGTVMEALVQTGDYITEGTAVVRIADVKALRVVADIPYQDAVRIQAGDSLAASPLLPGAGWNSGHKQQIVRAVVDHIDPFADSLTRTIRIYGRYRTPDTESQPSVRPEQLMAVQIHHQTETPLLLIPEQALLWTGEESLVYTMKETPSGYEFQARRVTIGVTYGNFRHVIAGLDEGERVVTNGAFRIDSEFQLSGLSGMMR